jgi:thiol-disulfide isomerase/thioredoxin
MPYYWMPPGAPVPPCYPTTSVPIVFSTPAQSGLATNPAVGAAVTVDDVIAMSRAMVGDELILNQIKYHGMAAPLRPADVIALHQRGVSPAVISAMQTVVSSAEREAPITKATQPAPVAGETVLLEFYAEWCGPCRSMMPIVDQLAEKGQSIRRVNIDEHGDLAKKYSVTSIPCFVMIVDGKEAGRVVGKASLDRLEKLCGETPLAEDNVKVLKGRLDESVVKMNAHAKYSLLSCPGKYTVQVAHFAAEDAADRSDINAIEVGDKVATGPAKSGAATAAEKAHDLTQALRLKGYEAYEFHDRSASMVTVGSFDSVGTPRPDGKIEINPEMHEIIERFRAPSTAGATVPKHLIGICFDAQPIPVEVPRGSSESTSYEQPEIARRALPEIDRRSQPEILRQRIVPSPTTDEK